MIESISISNKANFGNTPEVLSSLSKINFIFGGNGSGKTTISRIIANENEASHFDDSFHSCLVTWKNSTKLQTMVYNSDFIERNFNLSSELKGVFTLGEQQVETLEKITITKKEIDSITKKIEELTKELQGVDESIIGGKKAELSELEAEFVVQCWAKETKYKDVFRVAFGGLLNSKEKFKARVIQEDMKNNADLLSRTEIEEKAKKVFGQDPVPEELIQDFEMDNLLGHELNPILSKRVIGKDDVDIASMIRKLGNSDWVRSGRGFYEINDRICPFCQQKTDESFAQSLNEYFDESFTRDSQEIDILLSNYVTDAQRIQYLLEEIIANPSRFLEADKLKSEKALLDSKIVINIQKLNEKKKEASQIIELESLQNVSRAIKLLIDSANSAISEHNRIVGNIAIEKNKLTDQVWKFILDELKDELNSYKKRKDNLEKAITNIGNQILKYKEDKQSKNIMLRDLERQTTSVQPTVDGINDLLNKFGFQGFKLDKTSSGTSYQIIRSDGTDAKKTLSEGEKNFVCFLYFYHLLKGSLAESGITTNRVVVFDDPVSSLDSDILFIVSILIKGLFDEIRENKGNIKQFFILTHNVYFHKEIAFNPRRNNNAAIKDEKFWIMRKMENTVKVEHHNSNPITTSYDLLWAEIRNNNRSSITIQNTLRRILENYFKILGSMDPDAICENFDGQDKLICKSLFSWINDGSHFAHDDLYVYMDEAQIENFLRIFRLIFEKTNNLGHYKMMMGDKYVEEGVLGAP
jgi:wobble nucleotide-excising tRNase